MTGFAAADEAATVSAAALERSGERERRRCRRSRSQQDREVRKSRKAQRGSRESLSQWCDFLAALSRQRPSEVDPGRNVCTLCGCPHDGHSGICDACAYWRD
jgi:hypothetical protein